MKEDPAKSFMMDCLQAITKIISECKDRMEFISKMKSAGTFHADISKEFLEKQFAINAEREKYYDEVIAEIEPDNHSGGGKKSVLADLKKKKEVVKKQLVNKKYRNKQLEL